MEIELRNGMDKAYRIQRAVQTLKRLASLWAFVVTITLFALITRGRSISIQNLVFIFNQSVIIILAGMGLIFVMSQGSFNMSPGAIVALAPLLGYLSDQVIPGLFIPVTILSGAMVGAVIGGIFANMKVPSFILTLSASFIIRNTAIVIFGGIPNGLIILPMGLIILDEPVPKIIAVAALGAITAWLFHYNKIGKWCKAIGSDENVAKYSGVLIRRMKFVAFTISGLMAGITAIFVSIRTGSVTMRSGNFLEFDVLIALLLGGVPLSGGPSSRMLGVYLGAITISIINNGLAILNVTTIYQELVKGAMLLLLVAITFERGKVMEIK